MKGVVEVVAFDTADPRRVRAFFGALAGMDRTFIHADVLAPDVLDAWMKPPMTSRDRRYVATKGDDIVGYLAVLPENDHSAHVATIRIVVHSAHRRQGIASDLARHAVVSAARDGIKKLVVEVVADQDATVAMFTGLGFEAEGLLREHVLSDAGVAYDLLVLSHFVDELYETMTAAGVEEAITG